MLKTDLQLRFLLLQLTLTLTIGFALILVAAFTTMRLANIASNAILKSQVVERTQLRPITVMTHMVVATVEVVLREEVDRHLASDLATGFVQIPHVHSKTLLHELVAFDVRLLVPILLITTAMEHLVVQLAVQV